jgi:undecaprenyl-phosphate 4-deoxy-4-formamido-L-arabinose transferase
MDNVTCSLVIPVFNEQACLPELIDRCTKVMNALDIRYEILLVDDGSDDRSRQLIRIGAEHFPDIVCGVFLNRNYGQHAAVMAGFAEARGRVIVTLDADLQNPPEEIPKLLAKIRQGSDVVGSVRTNRRDTRFRRLASQLVNAIIRRATGSNMTDYGCMLRAYRREIVDLMLSCSERSTFIPALANSFAANPVEIQVEHADRDKSKSRYGLLKLINLQFDLLTSVTTLPLRLFSLIGAFMSLFGFSFGAFMLLMRLGLGPEWSADGVFTILAVLFFFIGVQLLALGVVGEYLGRIYSDVRARPRYLIAERTLGSEVRPLRPANLTHSG